VFGGSVDLPSGVAGDTLLAFVERYDVATDSWSELGAMPSAMHSHAALEVDATIYISGGVTGATQAVRTVSDQLLKYTPAGISL